MQLKSTKQASKKDEEEKIETTTTDTSKSQEVIDEADCCLADIDCCLAEAVAETRTDEEIVRHKPSFWDWLKETDQATYDAHMTSYSLATHAKIMAYKDEFMAMDAWVVYAAAYERLTGLSAGSCTC